MSDHNLEATVHKKFTTRAFATGIPTVLAGTPVVSVYEDDNLTQITAGVTLTVDFDSVVGCNHLAIAATAANGYEDGKNYQAVITTGTVGGVSVVGEVVAEFTIGSLSALEVKIDRNADLIESQRGAHTWRGNHYHVDPANGNDSTGDGSRALPYATVQAAHDDLVTDSNHDVIFLVPGAAAGVTTLTDDVILSKRYLLIRGPGRDFIWTRSGNGDTISITADGVELSGFQLETAATGAGHGAQITDADFVRIHNVWINATQGDGINILRGDNCQIHENSFTDTGQGGSGQGVHIVGTAGTSNYNIIYRNGFRDCAGDAIKIESGTTLNTHIFSNHIEGSTGWGINIGASSTDAFVTANTFGNNTSGSITDAGTTSVLENNEQWGTAVNLATVDTVVDGLATTLGVAGAGLTDLGGMSTAMKAEVESEANDALVAQKLDHLVAVADVDEPVNDSIMAKIASTTGDWSQFDESTDSLRAIRDRGDAAWRSMPTASTGFNNIPFLFVSSSDHVTPVTSATGTSVARSIDGGAEAAGTGTLAEVGNGLYQYDASTADMTGGKITFRFSATGGTPDAPDDRFVTIVTNAGI